MKAYGLAEVKPASEELVAKFVEIMGEDAVSNNDGKVVIKPANEEQLSKAVVAAIAAEAGITPVSRATGYVGNSYVFVDMSAMSSIIELDPVAMTIKVQAGAKFADIVEAAAAEGFTLGVIPGGADSTVSDWIYSEEPGVGSYKYGTVKDSVYNIVAVGYDGALITTGYDKIGYYMSGYNLIQALCASYGEVAIATSVTFKLAPAGVTKAVFYTAPDFATLQAAYAKIAQEPSVKPLHISWKAGEALGTVIAFQGEEAFVDKDIEALDAIMADAGLTKGEGGDEKFAGILDCDCVNPINAPCYLPLVKFADFIEAAKGIAGFDFAGTVPDCSTVVVRLFGNVSMDNIQTAAAKAEEMGGRFGWCCPCRYFGDATNALVDRIEAGFYGIKPEEPKVRNGVTPEVIEQLKAAVGPKNVSVSDVDRIIYCHDLAPLPKESGMAFNNIPDVIVRPENTRQIAAVMKVAYANGVPVTPRGNATWGLGGCMPAAGGIILDMTSKMKRVLEINKEERYVTAEAGITWKRLLEACMKEGYIVGSYPSSFPAGTVGAWISTNGMGIGSYKYGSAKDNILNVEAVLDDGSIVNTGYKATGPYSNRYNLNQFFAGAEGTLAMLGTVTFRIYPMGEFKYLAYEFDNLKDANQPIQDIIANASVKPLHIAWSDYMHFENQRKAGLHAPDVANLLLVTLQGDAAHNDMEEAIVDAIAEKSGGRKVAGEIAEHEWEERCYEFRVRTAGVGSIPAEVIVPAHDWGAFVDESYQGFETMHMEAGGIIGVMVDRSTTLFMPYYFKDDELLTGMLAFGFNFFLGDKAAKYGGRSTGLGVFFAWMLDVIHDEATTTKMRDIKTVLDPHDVVNPGHVVCGSTRFGINLSKPIMSLGSTLMQTIKPMLPKDNTFSYNLGRFRYDKLEHDKVLDRVHTLGDGTQ